MEEPAPKGCDVCQVQFKDCQRANVLPGNVKTKDLRSVEMYQAHEGQCVYRLFPPIERNRM